MQSDGERLIAEILSIANIRYRYDERFRILDGYAIRPTSIFLNSMSILNTGDYKIGMLKKQLLYQQQGKRLISLFPKDKPQIKIVLIDKLEQYR